MAIFGAPSGPNVNPNANSTTLLYVTSSIFMVVSLVGVLLRFLSRRLARIPLMLDDWLIVASLPFAWAICVINIYGGLHNGEGRHIQFSTLASLHRFFQATYVFEICYNVAIGLSKFSLIYFYRRIFSTESCKRPLQATAVLTMMWLIATTLVVIFSCTPVSGFWDIETPAVCIDERAYYIGQAVTNILLDLVLLVLPAIVIMQLKIARSQKWAITGIFTLGIFVTVCSAVRLSALIFIADETQFDVTYDIVNSAVWSVVECNLSILCACLPSMRPLLRLAMTGSAMPSQNNSSQINRLSNNVVMPSSNHPFDGDEDHEDEGLTSPRKCWIRSAANTRHPADHYLSKLGVSSTSMADSAWGDRERGASDAYEMLGKDQGGIKVDTSVTWYMSRRGSVDAAEQDKEIRDSALPGLPRSRSSVR